MQPRHFALSPGVAVSALLLLGYFVIPVWGKATGGGGHAPSGHAPVGHFAAISTTSVGVFGKSQVSNSVFGVKSPVQAPVSVVTATVQAPHKSPVQAPVSVVTATVQAPVKSPVQAPVSVVSVRAPVQAPVSVLGLAQISAVPVGVAATDPSPVGSIGSGLRRIIQSAWTPDDAGVGPIIESLTRQAQNSVSSCSLDSPDCIADVLDKYAAALQQIAPRLPPALRKLPNIVAAAARRARASRTPQEAMFVMRSAVAEVHKAIALLQADDPITFKAETREGALVAGTLLVAQYKLETAVGL